MIVLTIAVMGTGLMGRGIACGCTPPLEQHVAAGRLGRKWGRGVHDYGES